MVEKKPVITKLTKQSFVSKLPVSTAETPPIAATKDTIKPKPVTKPIIAAIPLDVSTGSWFTKVRNRIINYYGLQSRPDLVLLFTVLAVIITTIGVNHLLKKWDDKYGYLGGLTTKIKLFHNLGLNRIMSLTKPMNDAQLESYFGLLRQAGQLDKESIWKIKTLASARQAHDAFFQLRPFFRDKTKNVNFMLARVNMLLITKLALIVLPYFLIGYVLWALIKYFKYWTKASTGFLLEVQYKYLISYIVYEISKIFSKIVTVMVKALTLGIVKKTIDIGQQPEYSKYVDAWWKKYVKPLVNDVNHEYGCRIDEAKRATAKAVGMLLLPVKQIYVWYIKLRRYGLDQPFEAFKRTVVTNYPAFVESNGRYADNLQYLDKKFYNLLRKNVEHAKGFKRLKRSSRKAQVNKAWAGPNKDISIDLRKPPEKQQDVCQIIK